ncbi:MAG TPA: hypothetical protein VFN41_05015 [Candidatus Limnocylindrales bacterium]|nr:hypothetical protein [Candidatus Limnocylindrales bacterium]
MTVTTSTFVDFDTPTDYRDELKAYVDRVRWLMIPSRRYLAIDGTEPPGSPAFKDAIATLYPVGYGIHFGSKERLADAPVGALQGLYWLGGEEPRSAEAIADASAATGRWRWRLMLPIPDGATSADVEGAIRTVRAKKAPPLIDELWIHTWEEGPVGQILHLGPYADEPATIARLQASIAERGLQVRGVHHEIYISDPNRARPDRMKTLLRLDVAA